MSQLGDDLAFVPEHFSGHARLFPLPNLVLFPHVIQPLHIFEPRYVAMFEEAIADDRLIAMALLSPGWEDDYNGRPPIAPVACLGRVLTWQAQPNGRYNLLLQGLGRVQIVREQAPSKSFRSAEVKVLEDHYPVGAAETRRALQRSLAANFEQMLPQIRDAEEMFNQLAVDRVSLGLLTDVISYALELDVPAKQALLAETNVDRRAKTLVAHLQQSIDDGDEQVTTVSFPPTFSSN